MIRVLFRAHDNGQVFPVYFNREDEIADAAIRLKSDVVSQEPTTQAALELEQLESLLGLKGRR